MTKRAEAKYKIDRRMGENIWGRPRSPFNKREYGPGQHGQRRKGKATDFGTQLKAKQKVKGYYGNISERQFHKYYVEALRLKGDSSANLIGLLERRLDAVIYRAKFVPTVFAARQFINHGHIKVNGRRVNIASYQVKVGDLDRDQGILAPAGHRDGGRRARRARRARLCRGRPRQGHGQDSPASPASPKCPIRPGWSRTSSSNSTRADRVGASRRPQQKRAFCRLCAPPAHLSMRESGVRWSPCARRMGVGKLRRRSGR